MKIIFDSETRSVVLFEKGDEPIALLAALAGERDRSFTFSMIGGCSEVKLGYYEIAKQDYLVETFTSQNFELITVTGNVAWYEGKPMVHAHGVFGKEEYKTFGGHIMSMIISATGETVIEWLPVKLEKKIDSASGLKLFCDQKTKKWLTHEEVWGKPEK